MSGPTSDLSKVDYYALLSIPPTASESEIRRAYRKTSILYHPDKVEPTPANLEKFHTLQQALNTLTDPEEKAKYDQARSAKLRRAAEEEKLDARRRGLREELEKAEREGMEERLRSGMPGLGGQKRTWSEREVRMEQIKSENRRRMEEMKARRAKEAEEVRERLEREKAEKEAAAAATTAVDERDRPADKSPRPETDQTNGTNCDSEDTPLDRSVKVRWVKELEGLEIDAQSIEEEFQAGEIEHVVILKDKKRRIEGRGKVNLGTAMVVFKNLRSAKKAVLRGPWDGIESVGWAREKEEQA
jgi:DnaJ homolog subfamily C member 17